MKTFRINLLLEGNHSISAFDKRTMDKDVKTIEEEIYASIDDGYRLIFFEDIACEYKINILPNKIVAFTVYEIIEEK